MCDLTDFKIFSNDQEMNGQFQLMSVETLNEINKVPCAWLEFVEGDVAQAKYAISDSSLFAQGKLIRIELNDLEIFEGVVVNKNLTLERGAFKVIIELKDLTFKLTRKRINRVYKEVTDNDVIDQIAAINELTVSSSPPPSYLQAEIVQYYCTEWDFILIRAEINGWFVAPYLGSIEVKEFPDRYNQPDRIISFSKGDVLIYEFEGDIGAEDYFGQVKAMVFDVANQEIEELEPEEEVETFSPEDVKEAEAKLGGEEFLLQHPVPAKPDELQTLAKAKLKRSQLSLFKGKISIGGDASFRVGDLIGFEELSDSHNSVGLITKVEHNFVEGFWKTILHFGQEEKWHHNSDKFQQASAGGLVHGIQGIHVGIVEAFEKDPDAEFRIRVRVPAFKGDEQGVIWARVMQPYAGKDHGTFFIPEVNDEVVVGFYNNDPRYGVILGSVFSSANTPPDPFQLDDKNEIKGWVTKDGVHQIVLDQGTEKIEIKTKNQSIVIDESGEELTLTDKSGNTLTMSSSGIALDSKNDVEINAKNFKVSASAGVSIEGGMIELK